MTFPGHFVLAPTRTSTQFPGYCAVQPPTRGHCGSCSIPREQPVPFHQDSLQDGCSETAFLGQRTCMPTLVAVWSVPGVTAVHTPPSPEEAPRCRRPWHRHPQQRPPGPLLPAPTPPEAQLSQEMSLCLGIPGLALCWVHPALRAPGSEGADTRQEASLTGCPCVPGEGMR